MDWVIEYWNPETYEATRFSSLDGLWQNAPDEHVVFVWVFLNNGEHIICLKGNDYYYLTNRIFGCFNDEVESETSVADPGCVYEILAGELVRVSLPGHRRPAFVDERDAKAGVWVTGEWAESFGLAGENAKPKSAPMLQRYH